MVVAEVLRARGRGVGVCERAKGQDPYRDRCGHGDEALQVPERLQASGFDVAASFPRLMEFFDEPAVLVVPDHTINVGVVVKRLGGD